MMKILIAMATALLFLTVAAPIDAIAALPREQWKCFKDKRGERYCQVTSTVKMPVGQTTLPRSRKRPPPVFNPVPVSPDRATAYGYARQICRLEDHYGYTSRHGYGYGRYNVEPRIIRVDDELRKRDMPVCLRGQYPYAR